MFHTSSAQVSSVAVNAQGSRLVTANWDRVVGLFITSLPTWHGRGGRVRKAAWHTNGRSIFSAGWDFTVREWDTGTGLQGVVKTAPYRVRLTLGPMAGVVPLLATGTSDRVVCIFDLRAPTPVQLTLPHSSPVSSLVPHPTVHHLLTSATLPESWRSGTSMRREKAWCAHSG
ncbi:WD40 repeat-like protein [Calocera cornea HHB12733]|uniref:WD40 repeat-like protein n=1 Tax=Calocera cornea HHB12733 TaxID=1353952 RepID=A0A165C828_9BASI|nr:WD40 repeat-like protein [Calocera cornea HHB12733]